MFPQGKVLKTSSSAVAEAARVTYLLSTRLVCAAAQCADTHNLPITSK